MFCFSQLTGSVFTLGAQSSQRPVLSTFYSRQDVAGGVLVMFVPVFVNDSTYHESAWLGANLDPDTGLSSWVVLLELSLIQTHPA